MLHVKPITIPFTTLKSNKFKKVVTFTNIERIHVMDKKVTDVLGYMKEEDLVIS